MADQPGGLLNPDKTFHVPGVVRQNDLLIQDLKKIVQDNGQQHHIIQNPNDRNKIRDDVKRADDQTNQHQQNRFVPLGDSRIVGDILKKSHQLREEFSEGVDAQTILPAPGVFGFGDNRLGGFLSFPHGDNSIRSDPRKILLTSRVISETIAFGL